MDDQKKFGEVAGEELGEGEGDIYRWGNRGATSRAMSRGGPKVQKRAFVRRKSDAEGSERGACGPQLGPCQQSQAVAWLLDCGVRQPTKLPFSGKLVGPRQRWAAG
ncbi:hypothetical protein Salat_0128600 [Sesamum alatum]|uniref:Uncharacterized protein n=1 Tax=Sesamum alatum TaxID=300844 RepID=A0AAE2CXE3_9LAMI|nr:hypothetical protein Salat_0128600 [Sesamum alatum]